MKYRYDESTERGEIIVFKEFGQQCKRCNRMVKPKFDLEATEKAMSKLIDRIKRDFYKHQATSFNESSRHSRAKERKKPHDSSRCEACQKGQCHLAFDFDYHPRRRGRRTFDKNEPDRNGFKKCIPWLLRIDLNQTTHPRKFRCAICDVESQDRRGFNEHLSGKKHLKKVNL